MQAMVKEEQGQPCLSSVQTSALFKKELDETVGGTEMKMEIRQENVIKNEGTLTKQEQNLDQDQVAKLEFARQGKLEPQLSKLKSQRLEPNPMLEIPEPSPTIHQHSKLEVPAVKGLLHSLQQPLVDQAVESKSEVKTEPSYKRSASHFLSQQLQLVGFGSPAEALYQCVKEFTDNSIDACLSLANNESISQHKFKVTVAVTPAIEVQVLNGIRAKAYTVSSEWFFASILE